MAGARIVFLMYHELELAGRKLCQSEPGYVRYILPVEEFRSQLAWMKQSGFRGLSVSEASLYSVQPAVGITFDDGCETDLIAAAPLLAQFGFHATFYVTAGFLDTPGYMTSNQLQELDKQGFEIGGHSLTHRYLSDLAEAELTREIMEGKQRIEQILGHSVEHFSCPGGRYDSRTIDTARRAGFRTVANSDCRANSAATSNYELGRVAMLRGVTLNEFGAICHGRGLWKKRFRQRTRHSAQQLLGNRAYDQLRSALLGEPR